MKRTKRPETPITLMLWLKDGWCTLGDDLNARDVRFPEVEVGRTASKRRLGFSVQMTARAPSIDFTLDRVQVRNLRDHLDYQLRRLKK